MNLEDLYKAKKISVEQKDHYLLFHANELGRMWLQEMLLETFMAEAPPELMTTGALAHLEGRRSIIRQVKADIDYVCEQLSKVEESHE